MGRYNFRGQAKSGQKQTVIDKADITEAETISTTKRNKNGSKMNQSTYTSLSYEREQTMLRTE